MYLISRDFRTTMRFYFELPLRRLRLAYTTLIAQEFTVGEPSIHFSAASHLLDSGTGDVIIVIRDENDSEQKLYASKEVLTTTSEYFAASMTPSSQCLTICCRVETGMDTCSNSRRWIKGRNVFLQQTSSRYHLHGHRGRRYRFHHYA